MKWLEGCEQDLEERIILSGLWWSTSSLDKNDSQQPLACSRDFLPYGERALRCLREQKHRQEASCLDVQSVQAERSVPLSLGSITG